MPTTSRTLIRLTQTLLVGAAFALALTGCPDRTKTNKTGCSQDLDCVPENSNLSAAAFQCDTQSGACYCRTNDACPPSKFCNTAGYCQDRSGCEKNEDCLSADLFCDTGTGTCLSKGRCTTDLHCPLGQVCDIAKSTCVEGCRRDGDCPGISCRCGDKPCACTGTTQAEIEACEIGTCDSQFCSNDSFCPYGMICGSAPDAGTPGNECYTDYDPKRRPYCDGCQYGAGITPCGSGPNFCLVDTAHPGNYFCGADCSEGQSCPRGYACQDVIVVGLPGTTQCDPSHPACPANTQLPCATDDECKFGGSCVKQPGMPNGYCAGVCAAGENDGVGFCTCQTDSDCGQETCSGGECSISRKSCVTNDDCHAIHCVDFNGVGGCLIGQNCAPDEGLTCLEVQ